jgi:hypothetical protein
MASYNWINRLVFRFVIYNFSYWRRVSLYKETPDVCNLYSIWREISKNIYYYRCVGHWQLIVTCSLSTTVQHNVKVETSAKFWISWCLMRHVRVSDSTNLCRRHFRDEWRIRYFSKVGTRGSWGWIRKLGAKAVRGNGWVMCLQRGQGAWPFGLLLRSAIEYKFFTTPSLHFRITNTYISIIRLMKLKWVGYILWRVIFLA